MHDFPQATHAFSAQLILTNNISLYKNFPHKNGSLHYLCCIAKLLTKRLVRQYKLIKLYDFLINH